MLNVTVDGLAARRKLGDMIKNARLSTTYEGGEFTQATLGKLVGCSQSKINKIELGNVGIKSVDLDKIIEQLDVDPTTAASMRELMYANSLVLPWSGDRKHFPEYSRKYIGLEQHANEILSWHESQIPGPLQSEQYMLEHFNVGGEIDVGPHIRNRLQRKRILRRPDLQRYQCVLGEEALYRAAHGLSYSVAIDQIDHFLAINDPDHPARFADSRTSIHLLPLDARLRYPYSDFSILHFADRNDSLVYIEHVAGSVECTDPDEVSKACAAWEQIVRTALIREDTQEFLQDLRSRFCRARSASDRHPQYLRDDLLKGS